MTDPQRDKDEVKTALDHAWSWFSLHAAQRLQSVNFFLVSTAFLSAAFVTAAKERMYALAGGVAILAVLISYFFYRMERRIRSLIHAAEYAIQPLQDELSKSLNVDALRIVTSVEETKTGEWKYSKVFRYLYFTTGAAFGMGLIYVAWKAFSTTPDAAVFKAVVQAVLGVFLIVCGYEMLSSGRPSPQQDKLLTATRVSLLILGSASALSGIVIIVHLIFVRL